MHPSIFPSLSRMFVKFSLKLIYFTLCRENFKIMEFTFVENALKLDIFTMPHSPLKIPPLVLIITTYNHFRNILRLFDVLPNFPFTTSETIRDYYKNGLYKLPHELPNHLRPRILGN